MALCVHGVSHAADEHVDHFAGVGGEHQLAQGLDVFQLHAFAPLDGAQCTHEFIKAQRALVVAIQVRGQFLGDGQDAFGREAVPALGNHFHHIGRGLDVGQVDLQALLEQTHASFEVRAELGCLSWAKVFGDFGPIWI